MGLTKAEQRFERLGELYPDGEYHREQFGEWPVKTFTVFRSDRNNITTVHATWTLRLHHPLFASRITLRTNGRMFRKHKADKQLTKRETVDYLHMLPCGNIEVNEKTTNSN